MKISHNYLGNHVVDQPVLVPDALGLVCGLVLGLVDPLEDVLEHAVVRLQDGVLRRQVERESAIERELEAAVRKVNDRCLSVVHPHGDAGASKVVDCVSLFGATVFRLKDELQLSGALDLDVGGLVLVGVGVTSDNDRLLPGGDQPLIENQTLLLKTC